MPLKFHSKYSFYFYMYSFPVHIKLFEEVLRELNKFVQYIAYCNIARNNNFNAESLKFTISYDKYDYDIMIIILQYFHLRCRPFSILR